MFQALLLYAVGGGPSPEPAPLARSHTPIDIRELLLTSGLIVLDPGSSGEHKITQKGFQFLLSDTYSQLWKVLREYITRVERDAHTSLASVLGFLLQLGVYTEVVLDAGSLSPVQQDIAAHMAQLGLLYATNSSLKNIIFRPTYLASLAASGNDSAVAKDDGFVVVETNFRVYAYTSSPVRQAILRLFIRCDVLLPNLFVGTITRESATVALESGVSAEQMIGYLRQHAHPQVQDRVPVVPGVVADQLRLWHRELHRLSHRNSIMYKNFEHTTLYKEVVAFVENCGSLLSKDDQKQEILADAEVHDRVRDKIKSIKHSLGIV